MVKPVANPGYTPIAPPAQPFPTFNEFYPFYMGKHSNRISRIFHLTGTTIALAYHTRVILSLFPYIARRLSIPVGPQTSQVLRKLQLSRGQAFLIILSALMQGDFFAMMGGVFIARYIPPSFKYHMFALRGDLRMLWEVVSMQRSI